MWRTILIAAGVTLVASGAGATTCEQPYAPQVSLSANAGEVAMAQAHDDVQSYIQASDIYQKCLVDAANRDSGFRARALELISSNQQQKQRIGDSFNAAVKAFNKSHSAIKTSDARN
jgi:hypothetical protein